MKNLFAIDFVGHYGITTRNIMVDESYVTQPVFDIDDKATPFIVAARQGQVSLSNVHGGVDVLAYEKFINNCKKPIAFSKGLKRCDYVLTSHSNNLVVCLLEMTSAEGSTLSLGKPILNKESGAVMYAGGKYEKVEDQLFASLSTMLAVPAIANDFRSRIRRVCLMSYVVYPYSSLLDRIKHPFMRYLGIESRETRDAGTWINCPAIQALGFEYRRISHDYTFTL